MKNFEGISRYASAIEEMGYECPASDIGQGLLENREELQKQSALWSRQPLLGDNRERGCGNHLISM